MPRYAKQTDNFRCGPFALLNVLKWAGAREYKVAPLNAALARTDLHDLCQCDEDGTGIIDFDKALRTLPEIKVKRVWKIKPGVLKKHLRSGGSAVVGFDYISKDGTYEEHFGFFTEITKTHLTCINHKEQTKYKMSHKEFRRMFNKRFAEPLAWLISRDYKIGEIIKLNCSCGLINNIIAQKNKMFVIGEIHNDEQKGRQIQSNVKMIIWPPSVTNVYIKFYDWVIKRTTEKERFLYHLFGSKALIEERIN